MTRSISRSPDPAPRQAGSTHTPQTTTSSSAGCRYAPAIPIGGAPSPKARYTTESPSSAASSVAPAAHSSSGSFSTSGADCERERLARLPSSAEEDLFAHEAVGGRELPDHLRAGTA